MAHILVNSLKGFRVTLIIIMISYRILIINQPTHFKSNSPYEGINASQTLIFVSLYIYLIMLALISAIVN